jgi:hypothetical protein
MVSNKVNIDGKMYEQQQQGNEVVYVPVKDNREFTVTLTMDQIDLLMDTLMVCFDYESCDHTAPTMYNFGDDRYYTFSKRKQSQATEIVNIMMHEVDTADSFTVYAQFNENNTFVPLMTGEENV